MLGDLNDGPGLDYFEELYLTHNVTDIVVGSAFRPEWQFTHAQHDVPAARALHRRLRGLRPDPRSSGGCCSTTSCSRPAADGCAPGSGAIRHAEYDAQVVNGGVRRQDRPTDHRPVTVDLEY